MKAASNKVKELISRKEVLNSEKMMLLYESHGITPELVERISEQHGVQLSPPTDFYKKLAERHLQEKRAEKTGEFDGTIKPTRLVYYEKPFLYELQAKVLDSKDGKLVLDQTVFYPEGGGQCGDRGWIEGIRVSDTQKQEGLVIHHVEKSHHFAKGKTVSLLLDKTRREDIRKHHSATHVVLQSARRVLGKHVWQAGSRKDEDEAHVDITHYKKISDEERGAIERLANEIVRAGLPIKCSFQPRKEAEQKYGFMIYQGGGPPGDTVRIVEVGDYDVECCGGTHCENTKDIGFIKIVGIDQVQDGVLRLRYKAGDRALAHVGEQEKYLKESAGVLSVHLDELPSAVKRFFDEWKMQKKELEELWEKNADNFARDFAKSENIKMELNAPQRLLEKIVLKTVELNPKASVVLWNKEGFIAAAAGKEGKDDAILLLQSKNAKGGGKKDFARGKIS